MPPFVLTTQTLSLFSRCLLNCPRYKFNYQADAKNAAVLMLLCHDENHQPSVLFTVRNKTMRTHRGEISFPGGKEDPSDASLQDTALRETHEEVGIKAQDIDILGSYSTVPNKTGSLRVHPYVGYVRKPIQPGYLVCNPNEVSHSFCLSLDYLARPSVRELRSFRDTSQAYTVFHLPHPIEGEQEIWGLTSFILDGVLRKIMPDQYH
ncbi:NUDIX hydrolase domain-like protein [Spinellus fusiger]|nr:NUDIX hydrolase domain-like protein [Spinellus fusiger]